MGSSGNYVLWNEIDYDLIQVKEPKKNEKEITSGKKGKSQKISWYSLSITYLYPEGEDELRVMWNNIDITGITISSFENNSTEKEQIGHVGNMSPEHRDVRDKIRRTILEKAGQYKDTDEDLWDVVTPDSKKFKLYWKSKDKPPRTKTYFPLTKGTRFFRYSPKSRSGFEEIKKSLLAETEDVKLKITADLIEAFRYVFLGTQVSIKYQAYQILVKKISRKDSQPIFKKKDEIEDDDDEIVSALGELNEKHQSRDDDDDEDVPKKKVVPKKLSGKDKVKKYLEDSEEDEESEEESDEEEEDKKKKKKDNKKKEAKKPVKKQESDEEGESEEEESEEEVPKKSVKKQKQKTKKPVSDEENEDEDEE